MALCAVGVERDKKKGALRSVVVAHEAAGGAPKTAGRESSVKTNLEFFTETAREREREREREKGGGHVCLDAALSQKHCYRQSRYKDGE